jgi:hypothetical protein
MCWIATLLAFRKTYALQRQDQIAYDVFAKHLTRDARSQYINWNHFYFQHAKHNYKAELLACLSHYNRIYQKSCFG